MTDRSCDERRKTGRGSGARLAALRKEDGYNAPLRSAVAGLSGRAGAPGHASGRRRLKATALRPAGARDLNRSHDDLTAAGPHHLCLAHAAPFGSGDEQRRPARAAEGAGEAAAVQLDDLPDLAALSA